MKNIYTFLLYLILIPFLLNSAEFKIFNSANSPLNPEMMYDIGLDSLNTLWVSSDSCVYTFNNSEWNLIDPDIIEGPIYDICVSPEGKVCLTNTKIYNEKNLFFYNKGLWESYIVDLELSVPSQLYFNTDSTLWLSLWNYWGMQLGENFLAIFKDDTIIIRKWDKWCYGLSDFVVAHDTVFAVTWSYLVRNYQENWEVLYPQNYENDHYVNLNTIEMCNNKIYTGGEIFLVYDHHQFYEIADVDTFLSRNNTEITCLCIQNDSTVLIGTDTGSILKFSDSQFEEIYRQENHRIFDIEIDKNENMWFSIKDVGLVLFNENQIVRVAYREQKELQPENILIQNFPNPFNPITHISFNLSYSSEISISVYNISGKKVSHTINGFYSTGNHIILFDGSDLTSGLYVCQLKCKDQLYTKKMLLIK